MASGAAWQRLRAAQSIGVLLEDEGVPRATFILDPERRVVSVTANALNVGRSGPETLRLVQAFQARGLGSWAC